MISELRKYYLIFILFLFAVNNSFSQISVQHEGTLKELFNILQNKYGYWFIYSNSDINDRHQVTVSIKKNMDTFMQQLSEILSISYEIKSRQIIIKKTEVKEAKERKEIKEEKKAIIKSAKNTPIEAVKITEQKNITIKDTVLLPQQYLLTVQQAYSQPLSKLCYHSQPAVNSQPQKEMIKEKNRHRFALYHNLLYDLVLTPNIGAEYVLNNTWGIQINTGWTHLNWGENEKTYRIWYLAPEIRYYFTKKAFLFRSFVSVRRIKS